jgi:hypothetical protein
MYRMHIVAFLSTLNNLIMEVTPDKVIPHLVPANRNCNFDLLHLGWCYETTHFCIAQLQELYHLLEFPAMFVLSERRHYGSSEEAFIITLMKLATGDSNAVLGDCFGFSGDGMISSDSNMTEKAKSCSATFNCRAHNAHRHWILQTVCNCIAESDCTFDGK